MAVNTKRREREIEDDDDRAGGDTVMVGGMEGLVEDREVEDDDEGLDNKEAQREQRNRQREEDDGRRGRNQDDDDEEAREREAEEDARLAYSDTDEGVQEDRGMSRRARRNRARRQAAESSSAEIMSLRDELAKMQKMVGSITNGHMGLAVQNIDNQINALKNALSMADAEIAKAVAEGNGVVMAQAMRVRDEANARLWRAESQREAIVREAQRRPDPAQPQGQRQPRQQQEADPRTVEFGERFMERHPWFDAQGRDERSAAVLGIDRQVAMDGYPSNTKAYWTELERRMRRVGLDQDDDDDGRTDGRDDDGDDNRRRRPARRLGMPPRRGGHGGNRGNGTNWKVPPALMEYFESEGLDGPNLSKEDQAKRDRIIKEVQRREKLAKQGAYARG